MNRIVVQERMEDHPRGNFDHVPRGLLFASFDSASLGTTESGPGANEDLDAVPDTASDVPTT